MKLWIVLFIFRAAFASECSEDYERSQEMITNLQQTVICANDNGFSDCLEAISPKPLSYSPVGEELDFMAETCRDCNGNRTVVPSTSLPFAIDGAADLLRLEQHFGGMRREFVNSVEDYYHHMKMHKKRVVRLAMAAYDQFPELFPDIDRRTVRELILAHDKAKMVASVQDGAGRTFYRRLYELYGQFLPEEFFQELNHADGKFMSQRMRELGLEITDQMSRAEKARLKLKIRRLNQLEKLVDIVDRIHTKVSPEEFGRKMYPLGDNFKYGPFKKVASYLERNHATLTREFAYRPPGRLERMAIATRLRTQEIYSTLRGRGGQALAQNALRGMAMTPIRNAVKAMSMVSESLKLAKWLPILDGPLLFFADMDRLGCSELGMHSWTKVDGVCTPMPGLSAPFIEFLNLPEQYQRDTLYNKRQCQMLQETHTINNVPAFAGVFCRESTIYMHLASGKGRISVKLANGRPIEISLAGVRKMITGSNRLNTSRAGRILIDEDLNFTKWCGSKNRCVNIRDPNSIDHRRADRSSKLIRSLIRPISEALIQCQEEGSSLQNFITGLRKTP